MNKKLETPIKTSLSFVTSNLNEEETYKIKQKAYWEGHYVFTKDQVSKMGNAERTVLELIGLREYGKPK
jgi:hypothetical protein